MSSLIIFSFFYNRATEVSLSVTSLLKSAPPGADVVLVNDGSTDSTLIELCQFKSDSRVIVVDQENTGLSRTMATLIPQYLSGSRYKYIAIHGAGDVCREDKFRRQLEYLDANNDIVALGCGHRLISAKNGNVISISHGERIANYKSLKKNVPFTHGTVIYRAAQFVAAGGYDGFFKCCQDWDLYFRLMSLGKVVRFPEPLYDKYLFEDGVSFKPQKKIEQIKYYKIITSREISNAYFSALKQKVLVGGIDAAIPTSEIIHLCKRNQYAMILKGEFLLAMEWCGLIDIGLGNKVSQFFIKNALRVAILLVFPRKIFSSIYRRLH